LTRSQSTCDHAHHRSKQSQHLAKERALGARRILRLDVKILSKTVTQTLLSHAQRGITHVPTASSWLTEAIPSHVAARSRRAATREARLSDRQTASPKCDCVSITCALIDVLPHARVHINTPRTHLHQLHQVQLEFVVSRHLQSRHSVRAHLLVRERVRQQLECVCA
jgi:hypothetical protein